MLVRAVDMSAADGDAVSWSYVAQELRGVDNIEGSAVQMMMSHRTSNTVASDSAGNQFSSVQKLLQQFPSALPSTMPQYLVNAFSVQTVPG